MQKRQSKKELTEALLKKLDEWIKGGDTPEEAVERLSVRQYDFLIDQEIDLDALLLTTEQQNAIKEMNRKGKRRCSPNGYNKKYPEPKQNLYAAIVELIEGMGAEIAPREKQNFRDLDFVLDGTKYKIVLSNPRK